MNLSAIIAARHRAGFSAEAQNYFDRLDTAGYTTYVDYKQPLANYIDSLVTLGGAYWDDLESAASFVGRDTRCHGSSKVHNADVDQQ